MPSCGIQEEQDKSSPGLMQGTDNSWKAVYTILMEKHNILYYLTQSCFLGFYFITYLTLRESKIRATKDYKENLAEKLLCKPLGCVTFAAAQ